MNPRSLILLGVFAATTIILGVEKFAYNLIAPGYDVKLKIDDYDGNVKDTLWLETGIGDINCYFRFRVEAESTQLLASFPDRKPLTINIVSSDSSYCWYEISEDDSTTLMKNKFIWPSGRKLLVFRSKVTNTPLNIIDWKIFLENQEPDSQSRSSRRTIWNYLWFLLISLSIIGAIYQAKVVFSTPKESYNYVLFFENLISNLQYTSREKTGEIQRLLRMVFIEQLDVPTVLETFSPSPSRNYQIWIIAKRLIKVRLEKMVQVIEDALEKTKDNENG